MKNAVLKPGKAMGSAVDQALVDYKAGMSTRKQQELQLATNFLSDAPIDKPAPRAVSVPMVEACQRRINAAAEWESNIMRRAQHLGSNKYVAWGSCFASLCELNYGTGMDAYIMLSHDFEDAAVTVLQGSQVHFGKVSWAWEHRHLWPEKGNLKGVEELVEFLLKKRLDLAVEVHDMLEEIHTGRRSGNLALYSRELPKNVMDELFDKGLTDVIRNSGCCGWFKAKYRLKFRAASNGIELLVYKNGKLQNRTLATKKISVEMDGAADPQIAVQAANSITMLMGSGVTVDDKLSSQCNMLKSNQSMGVPIELVVMKGNAELVLGYSRNGIPKDAPVDMNMFSALQKEVNGMSKLCERGVVAKLKESTVGEAWLSGLLEDVILATKLCERGVTAKLKKRTAGEACLSGLLEDVILATRKRMEHRFKLPPELELISAGQAVLLAMKRIGAELVGEYSEWSRILPQGDGSSVKVLGDVPLPCGPDMLSKELSTMDWCPLQTAGLLQIQFGEPGESIDLSKFAMLLLV